MYSELSKKISKEFVKQEIDRMLLPFNYKCMAKYFVDGCDTPMELAGVMTMISLRMPLW